jgi:hypothetical protein
LLHALFFATAAATAPAACTSVAQPAGTTSSSSSSGSGGAGSGSSTSGTGGDLIGLGGFGMGGAAPCNAIPPASDAGANAVQALCGPGATNPADCPATAPAPGAPCPSADYGLQCGYDQTGTGFQLRTCNGTWDASLKVCSDDCTTTATAVPITNGPACGSQPDIPCLALPNRTDQELADATLHQIASCCPVGSEVTLVVTLQDGCATASAGPDFLVKCMNDLLAGRRIQCASTLSCMRTEWSTLP